MYVCVCVARNSHQGHHYEKRVGGLAFATVAVASFIILSTYEPI